MCFLIVLRLVLLLLCLYLVYQVLCISSCEICEMFSGKHIMSAFVYIEISRQAHRRVWRLVVLLAGNDCRSVIRGDDGIACGSLAIGKAVVETVDDEIGDAAELLTLLVAAMALVSSDTGEIDDDGDITVLGAHFLVGTDVTCLEGTGIENDAIETVIHQISQIGTDLSPHGALVALRDAGTPVLILADTEETDTDIVGRNGAGVQVVLLNPRRLAAGRGAAEDEETLLRVGLCGHRS